MIPEHNNAVCKLVRGVIRGWPAYWSDVDKVLFKAGLVLINHCQDTHFNLNVRLKPIVLPSLSF